MTKEEVQYDCIIKAAPDPRKPAEVISTLVFDMMEVYAKQQATAFGFHVLGADPNDPEMGGMEVMSKTYDQFMKECDKG